MSKRYIDPCIYRDMTGIPYKCDDCIHNDKEWYELPCDACCPAHSGFEKKEGKEDEQIH